MGIDWAAAAVIITCIVTIGMVFRWTAKIDTKQAEYDNKFAKIDLRFDGIDLRFKELENKLNSIVIPSLARIEEKLGAQDDRIRRLEDNQSVPA